MAEEIGKNNILKDSPEVDSGAQDLGSAGNNGGAVQDVPDDSQAGLPGEGSLDQINDVDTLRAMLIQERARAEDLFGKLARMQADFENYKRRSARDREDIYKYASEGLLMQLLPVLDNFDRALASKGEAPVRVIEGIEMIYRQFGELLEREGLNVVPALGEVFDPTRHEAVMQEEASGQPENTVTAELRKGYSLKGKVIRPAMVKVAKN